MEQAMKIENGAMGTLTQMDPLLKKATPHAATETPQPAKQVGDAFSVAISATAEHKLTLQDENEISRARVAAIRDQLASGTYNISGKDVANKILGVLKG